MAERRPVAGRQRETLILRETPCRPVLEAGQLVAARLLHQRFGEYARDACDEDGLFDFQRDGVSRARSIIARRGGVVIADSVGLGKTHVALELLRPAFAAASRITIVGPAALERHWRTRAHDFGPFEWLSFSSLSRGSFIRGPRDFVIIDEAHALRNPAALRYRHAQTLVRGASLALLTATPVNNSVWDLYHLIRLFAGDRDFADVGVASMRGAFEEASSECQLGSAASLQPVLREVLIRHTRPSIAAAATSYDRRFPAQRPPVPVYYAFSRPDGPDLLACVGTALLDLDFPVHRSNGTAPAELMRRSLFKRLESSIAALSCSFVRYDALLRRGSDALDRGVMIDLVSRSGEDADQLSLDELLYAPVHDSKIIESLRAAIARERALVAPLRRALESSDDAKFAELEKLLIGLGGQRVLLFTQYRDTARYLHSRLARRFRVGLVDGGMAMLGELACDRQSVVRRFAPVANAARAPAEQERLDVLIATDVLSEGFNLQDAPIVVSYDLPWNPIRLVQRVGRIDRLGSPHERVTAYHFLPGDLDRYLGLLERIAAKANAIDGTVGSDIPMLHAGVARALDRGDVAYLARLEQGADPFAIDSELRALQRKLPPPSGPAFQPEYAVIPARRGASPLTAMVAARVGATVEWIAVVGDRGGLDDRVCADLLTAAAEQVRPGALPSSGTLERVLCAARREITRRRVVVESAPLLPAGGLANRVGRRLLELAGSLPGGADPRVCARIEAAMERLAGAPAAGLADVVPPAIVASRDLFRLLEAIETLPFPDLAVRSMERPVELLGAIIRTAPSVDAIPLAR